LKYLVAMIRPLLLIIVSLVYSFPLIAQSYLDQYFEGNEYQKTQYLWKAHIEVSKAYESVGHRSFGEWIDSVYDESIRRDDPVVIATALFFKGFHVVYAGDEIAGLKIIEEAVAMAKHKRLRITEALLLNAAGYTYYNTGEHPQGLERMMRARKIFIPEDYYESEWARHCEYTLADRYYQIGNYDETIRALPVIVEKPDDYKSYTYQCYTLIGLAWRELENYDSALVYFYKTQNLAEKYNNKPWVGIAAGNIASIYLRKGEYDKALPFAQTDYDNNKGRVDYLSEGSALIQLARINVATGHADLAIAQLSEAKILFDSVWTLKVQLIKQKEKMYNVYADAYLLKNDFRNADKYLSMAMSIKDTIAMKNKASQYENVRVQLDAETYMVEARELEYQKLKAVLNRNFLIAGLLSICLISIFVYRSQRLKIKLIQLEKKRAEKELNTAAEQLDIYMESLREKNNLIEQFQAEKEALPDSNTRLETIEAIEKLQRHTIITEDDWRQFKQLFDKVHKGFFTRLKEKYPHLTPAETRLLALIKMKASTKEMAGMLGISPDSIKQARYRLRKKIGLPEEANLEEIATTV
jgi:tetratricopeptide (TPR) repeat protein/DNA-binding CsgD family transcriptional regulator